MHPVTVFETMGQQVTQLSVAQAFEKKIKHGPGAKSVHIVVGINHDWLMTAEGFPYQLNGSRHPQQQIRVRQISQRRSQKGFNPVGIAEIATQQNCHQSLG